MRAVVAVTFSTDGRGAKHRINGQRGGYNICWRGYATLCSAQTTATILQRFEQNLADHYHAMANHIAELAACST